MKKTGLLGLILAAAIGAGCYIDVDHVSDPRGAFEAAKAEIRKIDARGRAHELHVLAYDPDDHELVRVSLPMWLCRKISDENDWDIDDNDYGEAGRKASRHIRQVDFRRARPGLVVEVDEDDGEKVLVWLR